VRFLADENIPRAGIELLRARGHDVLAAGEVARGSSDAELLTRAVQERRILLTFDRDFGALAFRSDRPRACGIVLFRMVPVSPDEPATVLLALAGRPELELEGHFTVVDRDRARQRPVRQN
jgi:predicted nuclease of predicted toxin-antitoxin system